MTSLRIPYVDPAAPLATVADAARTLTDDDRAVARQIVLSAPDGVATVADLLAHLERLSPAERGALREQALKDAGLPSSKPTDAELHQERARMLAVSARSRPELRLGVDQRGLLKDLDDEEREMDRLAHEAERRAMEHESRREARARERPHVEAERRAERPPYPYGAP